ncbi:hypothetical protein LJC08_01465 [Methanimicrococcus sp. OttesenSCG-928-J09]|nr:hypothetical protein [Methanimicrococcus sp. OttesenSCG-928-J09]
MESVTASTWSQAAVSTWSLFQFPLGVRLLLPIGVCYRFHLESDNCYQLESAAVLQWEGGVYENRSAIFAAAAAVPITD